ncbi:hypothetical protein ACIP98_36475 [Streptomyces sp. NPDC088354]|uniref:hypothetical protein n=1 Tax=Streptomyces sp. NPDC088354 TaxID=3365856 RepID=UPI00382055BA
MFAKDIADASGISVTLIRRLLRPPANQPSRISRTTADAVLGIPIPPRHTQHPSNNGQGMTDATHAAVILTTLAAAGRPATHLATRLGISTQTIAAIRDHHCPRLRIRLDQRIRTLYLHLAATTPTEAGISLSAATRTRAYHQRRYTTAPTQKTAQPLATPSFTGRAAQVAR